jgi:hypothetical protein
MFKHKYDGVSASILNKAASRGSQIHEDIEFFDSIGGDANTPELKWYAKFREEYNLTPLANEYLVSDNEYLASSIDVVYEDMTLADIKTTSKLDFEYLSWQLSIYAYLFEMQNPGLKVKRLMAIWIPKEQYGEPRAEEVKRIPIKDVIDLIEADKHNEQYSPAMVAVKEANLPITDQVIEEVKGIIQQLNDTKERYETLKGGLKDLMVQNGCKKFTHDNLSMTLSDAYVKETFDTAAFRRDHPDMYEQYIKKTEVKESLTLKLK